MTDVNVQRSLFQTLNFFGLSRFVESEPLAFYGLYHGVVFEFDHNEVVQTLNPLDVVQIQLLFVVDVRKERAGLFVQFFVQRIVPVGCLHQPLLHPATQLNDLIILTAALFQFT